VRHGGTPHSCGSRDAQFNVLPDKSGVPAETMRPDFWQHQDARFFISRFCRCATSFRFGRMAFRWQWLLILLALSTGGERSFAASAREDRAYAAAVTAFQDGMWSRAETEFAQFVQKYPKSDRLAEAVLMQAEAEFKQGKLPPAIALLTARQAEAGNLADQYVYWIGEAQFQNGDFSAAAETFVALTRDFPESSLRLRVVVEAASSLAQTNEWPQVVSLLEETNSVFQRAAQMDSGNELVSRGQLLLARAKFAQNDFTGATAVLGSLNSQTLKPELDWQRTYLLYQVKLAAGDTNTALAITTNLVQIARLEKNDVLRAESVALRAGVLEQLGQKAGAVAAYQEILKLNPPVERQRQAILKMAELAIALDRFSDAEDSLQKFLAQFPVSAATDVALLTLGELHLKDYAASRFAGAATNHLPEAQARFDQFLGAFTNPASAGLAGNAYLDRGWCLWLAGKIPESLDAFKAAAQRLPPSEDLAVARFKMGDALFAQKDFTNALNSYRRVVEEFTDFPAVPQKLGDRALYQMLRANLELKDLAGASNTLARILKLYPDSDLADSSLLLVGEGLADARPPADARALFQKFVETSPNSPLRPQVELAVARTYEREQDWPSAIGQYENWRNDFPTNALRPQADYALALANFQAGNETNAFGLFTNFVAQFPTHDLAPLAQYWVADHYFRLGGTNYVDAERNYKMLYQNTNWQGSPLVYQARLMAGRAAMGLPSYNDAIDHFISLTSDTNCPPDLNAQALFAYGSALMLSDSRDTNNPLANFQLATNMFNQICQLYPTNEPGALAWNEIGDCDLQLGAFDAATNAYAQVFNSPFANISARSRAQIGFGIALEKKAALVSGASQNELLDQALDNYLDVFWGDNLRDGEQWDLFWVKKAGLQAAPLVGRLNDPDAERAFYGSLKGVLPQLTDLIEKKVAALLPAKN
jgi:TolA-binding protein